MDIAKKGGKEFKCHYVFIQTPTIDDLKERLIARGSETEDTLNKRLANAEKEMKMAPQCGLFSKIIINDDKKLFMDETVHHIVKELYNLHV